MKKALSTCLLLLVVMSFSVFAGDDGTMGGAGKSCPQGQTTCFVSVEQQPSKTWYETFYDTVKYYLA